MEIRLKLIIVALVCGVAYFAGHPNMFAGAFKPFNPRDAYPLEMRMKQDAQDAEHWRGVAIREAEYRRKLEDSQRMVRLDDGRLVTMDVCIQHRLAKAENKKSDRVTVGCNF